MITANATRIIIESRSIREVSTVRSEKRNREDGADQMNAGPSFLGLFLIASENSCASFAVTKPLVTL